MEDLTLEGRVAVVTGGASGIGRQIVQDLAALGATVVVAARNEVAAKEVASAVPRAVDARVDLTDPGRIESFASDVLGRFGRVDVLVSNAGWDKVGPFVDSDPHLWDRLIGINLRGPIQLTHRFLPAMMDNGWGRLVFVSSDAGRVGSKGEAVYAACKAGLMGFAKTVARESARRGVTSNVVCPGPTQTPLLAEVAAENGKLVETLQRRIPMGRLGQPEDVAAMVSFFASGRAEFVTGQTISVSGGLTMV